jgi:hypothetical protein
MPHTPDNYTAKGADKLKATILRYWLDRGFVNVRAERYELSPGIWGIRSNLFNGLPPAKQPRARLAA